MTLKGYLPVSGAVPAAVFVLKMDVRDVGWMTPLHQGSAVNDASLFIVCHTTKYVWDH